VDRLLGMCWPRILVLLSTRFERDADVAKSIKKEGYSFAYLFAVIVIVIGNFIHLRSENRNMKVAIYLSKKKKEMWGRKRVYFEVLTQIFERGLVWYYNMLCHHQQNQLTITVVIFRTCSFFFVVWDCYIVVIVKYEFEIEY
jgi:hypothetical protein